MKFFFAWVHILLGKVSLLGNRDPHIWNNWLDFPTPLHHIDSFVKDWKQVGTFERGIVSLSIVIACCVSSKRSNTCLHLITCPSFSKQAGKRMQSAEAAASENSALDMLVSGPGRTCNQADDNLSLCNQPQMDLLVLSSREWFSRLFIMRFCLFLRRFFLLWCRFLLFFYMLKIPFLAVQNSSIGDLVTHWLTHSVRYFYFCHTKSNPRDLLPLRHLIRVMRRHDLTENFPKICQIKCFKGSKSLGLLFVWQK